LGRPSLAQHPARPDRRRRGPQGDGRLPRIACLRLHHRADPRGRRRSNSLVSVGAPPLSASTLSVELRDRLVPIFGADIAIEQLALLAGGASKEAWALDLRTPQGTRQLLVRRAGGGVIHQGTLTLEDAHPAIELGLAWARGRAPERNETVVLHGDLRVGNLAVTATGLGHVLDWEFGHRGDPAEDVAWPLVRAWRFGVDQLRLGGIGDV